MDPATFSLAGAVPLNPKPTTAPGAVATAGAGVIDVTEATFSAEVLDRSDAVPVVIDFWASWCGPCKQLSPILERLAGEADGAWVLAKIDVDANPGLAQAAQVQGIPAVKAVVNGQVVGEFTGALPEAQVKQWVTQLVTAARQGTFGPMKDAPVADGAEPTEPETDADLAAGDDALMAGNLFAAREAYQRLADRVDAGPALTREARTGLARVSLLERAEHLDPAALAQRLTDNPTDVEAATGMADALLLSERAEDAFTLLVATIQATAGEERETARTHLLSLFELVGDADPAVVAARRNLARALF